MLCRRALCRNALQCILALAYLSLVVWMHLWTLEAGIPRPGEQGEHHHQVCTWLGTSAEAGFVAASLPLPSPPPVVFYSPPPLLLPPVCSASATLRARAPPFPSL